MFDSIYIGGGTPTVLSPEQLKTLLSVIQSHFLVSPDAECTIEANPKTLSALKLEALRESGINRLSLGIQTFSEDLLHSLGRLHTAQEAVEAFNLARSFGFRNISLDLIYGIPAQTPEAWDMTLDAVIAMKPEHISAYCLSLDEGSRFKAQAEAGTLTLPDDESAAQQYELAVGKLTRAGYERYEVSNFSFPGFTCRHNRNYWERGEYLGLGPGAWSFLNNRRYKVIADVHEYSSRMRAGLSVLEEEEEIDAAQAANETIMLGLRTAAGVDILRYEEQYGADTAQKVVQKADHLIHDGLLVLENHKLKFSERGFLLANQVLLKLYL